MKRCLFCIVITLAVCAGCGRKEDDSAAAKVAQPRAAKRAKPIDKTTPSDLPPVTNVFVSFDGKFTNLIYECEDAALFKFFDGRTIEELEKAAAASPDNPDLWFALAKYHWDVHGEVSNAVACFERASALAPDAMIPRMYLAEAHAARMRTDEAAAAFRDAYAYARADKERERWTVAVGFWVDHYTDRGFNAAWAIDLLEEVAEEAPAACERIAGLYLRNQGYDEALSWVQKGLAATTNVKIQTSLLNRLQDIRRQRDDDPEIEELYNEAIENSDIPELDKMLVKLRGIDYSDRESKYPVLCRQAAGLATNMAQRMRALSPLAAIYAENSARADELKVVLQEIVGTNTPTAGIGSRGAEWLRNVGATNEADEILRASLVSETNAQTAAMLFLKLADRGRDIDENAIDNLLERFPSNATVYIRIASFFRDREWHDQENECREKALQLLTDPKERASQVSRLIRCYLSLDDLDAADRLLSAHSAALSNSSVHVLSLARVYCAKGNTNEAFELLIRECGNAKYEQDKERFLSKLLTTRWPERRQREIAADTAREMAGKLEVNFRSSRRTRIFNMLSKSYLSLNRYDDALDACKMAFREGGRVGQFGKLCRLVNDPAKIELFIRGILSEGGSQTHFYVTAAQACSSAELPELACELYAAAWRTAESPWQRLQHARRAVQLAHELENFALRDEIIDALEKEYKEGKMQPWVLWSIGRMMREINMEDRYADMMKLYVEKAEGKKRTQALQQLAWWYMGRNDTSSVRNLIATHFEGRDLSPEDTMTVMGMQYILGNQSATKQLLRQFEAKLTNHAAIAMHGRTLLWALSQMGERDRARKLVKQWVYDLEFPAQKKMELLSFMRYTGGGREAIELGERILAQLPEGRQRESAMQQLLGMYTQDGNIEGVRRISNELLSSPTVSPWQLRSIAEQYERLNLPADALLVWERMLERAGDNESQVAEIRARQVKLYLKTGDAEAALECAREAAARSPNDANSQSVLADVYAANEQPQEAVDTYYRAMRLADNPGQREAFCNKIAELLHSYDVEFDASAVADTLLSENRTIQTMMTAATLLSVGGDMDRAGRLVKEAAASAKVRTQRAAIYQQWVNIVRADGDEAQLLDALRAYLPETRGWQKVRTTRDISSVLLNAGRYEELIDQNQKALEELKDDPRRLWAAGGLNADMARAHMELGDIDEAWKAAQGIPEGWQSAFGRTDWNTYMDLARQLGKTDEATAVLEEKFKKRIPRQSAQIALHLMQSYQDAGRAEDIAKLLEDAEELIGQAPQRQRASFANFYKEAGQPEKGIELLKDVIETGDRWQRRSAANQLFELCKETGKLDEALDWANKQPESSDSYAMMAAVYEEQNNHEKALEFYSKALESAGADQQWLAGEYRKKIAKAAAKTGDDSIVDKLVRKTLKELTGRKAEAHSAAAAVYRSAEKYDDAIDQFKKAIKLTRNKRELRGTRQEYASCLSDANKHDKAAATYEKILKDETLKWEDRIGLQNKLATEYEKDRHPNKARDIRDEIAHTCESFLKEHKVGGRAMNARFALADAYSNAGDKSEARRILRNIADKYKHTSAAKKAEKKLKEM